MPINDKKHNHWGFDDLMVSCAFEHCCGRNNYIVGVCVDWIIDQWPNFSNNSKAFIKRHLEKEIKRDDESRERGDRHHPLGHDCDRELWEKVRNLWSGT